jgi:3-deoxy-7-phosphoheptulonate synthase
MLIVMKPGASAADIKNVIRSVEELGYEANTIHVSDRTVIGVTGNKGSIDPAHFENLPGVADTVRITQPYRLTTAHPAEKRAVPIGNAFIGAGHFAMIAGPCALEDREQVFRTAKTVAESGARFFRGGAFKPRTSPYAFQGLGVEGLKMLAEVRDEFGLNIITEALDEHGVDAVVKYGDCVQIGARNMQNFTLLRHAGKCGKPVLLKRGLSATLDELLLAAEYILSEGNPDVVLCERGIRTFTTHSRNTLDLSIVPAVQRMSHLPIIVDPSHGTGKNYMVAALSRAAAAVGADGLLIEVHPCPEDAMCDGAQALRPHQYLELVKEIERIRDVIVTPSAETADARG